VEDEDHGRAAHAQSDRDLDRLADGHAVVVQPVLEAVVPVGDGLDLGAGEALDPREQLVGRDDALDL
jgi:hypothetical protein